jgi:hypothetical protein
VTSRPPYAQIDRSICTVTAATRLESAGGAAGRRGVKSSLLALLLLAACRAPAAAPTTPAVAADDELPTLGCWNGGEVVFRETTRSLRGDGAVETLTIYETGAWSLEGSRRERRGCLSAEQVSLLEERLATVRRARPDAPMCAAMPTYDSFVEVPGVGAIIYRWPCASGPDEATAAGIETARDLTWRSS